MSAKIIVDSTADMIPDVARRVKTVPLHIRSIGSVVGTYAGPGAVAVAFFSGGSL